VRVSGEARDIVLGGIALEGVEHEERVKSVVQGLPEDPGQFDPGAVGRGAAGNDIFDRAGLADSLLCGRLRNGVHEAPRGAVSFRGPACSSGVAIRSGGFDQIAAVVTRVVHEGSDRMLFHVLRRIGCQQGL